MAPDNHLAKVDNLVVEPDNHLAEADSWAEAVFDNRFAVELVGAALVAEGPVVVEPLAGVEVWGWDSAKSKAPLLPPLTKQQKRFLLPESQSAPALEPDTEVEAEAEVGAFADIEAQVVVSVVAEVVEVVVVEAAVPSPHRVCRIFGKTDPRLSIAFRNAYSTSWLMVIMR